MYLSIGELATRYCLLLELLKLATLKVYVINICSDITILHTIIHLVKYRLKKACILETSYFLVCEKILVALLKLSVDAG